MSGRHGRRAAGGPGHPQADTEDEAISTARTIAGLRSRLWHQDILRHPRVREELQELLEQVAILLGHADPSPGRHRAATAPAGQVSDADGDDLKPDPLTATTAAEFITALWQYRAWSGDPPWRKMADRARYAVVHSTMHAAMNADTLPKFEVVKAIINGCGGSEEDLQAFATAWRRIQPDRIQAPETNTSLPASPVPAL